MNSMTEGPNKCDTEENGKKNNEYINKRPYKNAEMRKSPQEMLSPQRDH